MPKYTYDYLRQHAFDSGMYNFLSDLQTNAAMHSEIPEWDNFVFQFALVFKSSRTELSNREALFVVSSNEPVNLFADNAEQLTIQQHLSFDRKYHDGISGDTRSLHYSHLTQEYRSTNNNLRYLLHVYFNSLGEVVHTDLKDLTLGQKTIAPNQDRLAEIIANANELLSELLSLKSNYQKSQEKNVERLLLELHKVDDFKLFHTKYQLAVEKAQRYADIYLIYPDLIAEIISKEPSAALDVQLTLTTEQTDSRDTKIAAKSVEKSIATHWLELKSDCGRILGNCFANYFEFMALKFALADLYILANIHKSDIADEIKVQLDNFNYSSEKLTTALQDNNISAEFLKTNFNNIEADIPPEFFNRMIDLCVTSTNKELRKKYFEICEFLFMHSQDYRNVITKMCLIDETLEDSRGDLLAPATKLLYKCFIMNNIDAFEMLLRHGVKLGNTGIFYKLLRCGKALSSYLVEMMIKLHLQNKAATKQKFKDFLALMLKPEFRSSFGVETVRNRISVSELRDRLSKIRALVPRGQQALAASRTEEAEQVVYFSVLGISMQQNLDTDIIKMFATSTSYSMERINQLCEGLACLITLNNYKMLVNDIIVAQNAYADRVVSSDVTENALALSSSINRVQSAMLNLRFYVSFDEGTDNGLLPVINKLIKDCISSLSKRDIEKFLSHYKRQIPHLIEKDARHSYEQATTYCFAVIILLVNLPQTCKNVQYYSSFFEIIVQNAVITDLKHREVLKQLKSKYELSKLPGNVPLTVHEQRSVTGITSLINQTYQDLKHVCEALVANNLITKQAAEELLRSYNIDINKVCDVQATAPKSHLKNRG